MYVNTKCRWYDCRNHAVTPDQKVLLTLRYYATGSFISACGDFLGVHKSTAGKIVREVSVALANLRPQFISMPNNPDDVKEVRQQFYDIAKFPWCIGAIDCTHIRICSPGGHEPEILKDFYSLNVQTICDARLRIRNIVARWPGSAHDSTIFNNSSAKRRLKNGEFGNSVIIGDSGYAIQSYLITPLLNVETEEENLFNESLIRTRNTVERMYGILKRRFPVLSLGMRVKIPTVQYIIVACAVLHNIAREFGEETPRVTRRMEQEIDFTNFNQHQLIRVGGNRSIHQRSFLNYFNSLAQQQ